MSKQKTKDWEKEFEEWDFVKILTPEGKMRLKQFIQKVRADELAKQKKEIIERFDKEVRGLQKGKWVDRNGAWMVRRALKQAIKTINQTK